MKNILNSEKIMPFLHSLFGFVPSQTKRQRFIIIVIHFIGWLIFFSLPLLLFNIQIESRNFLFMEAVNKLFLVAFFYLNYYYLIPYLFSKKKVKQYFFLLLFSFLLLLFQQIITEKIFFAHMQMAYRPLFSVAQLQKANPVRPMPPMMPDSSFPGGHGWPGMGPESKKEIFGIPALFLTRLITNLFSSAFLMVLLGSFIRLTFSFLKSQNEKKQLENTNLTAENNLLKSQINPHFLFNSLNSIYSLAIQKSGNTEKSILKLSEIMRYMIYETGAEKILIEKDIYYISSYIDLQRLRLSSKVSINFKLTGNPDAVYISPLILITYIENIFKHGISYTQPSHIDILIDINDKILTLCTKNPILKEQAIASGGIGQKNAKRRLDLLYPGKYELNIAEENDQYIVNLKINLDQ